MASPTIPSSPSSTTVSAAPSPTDSPTTSISRASTPDHIHNNNNSLDDIFGTSPPPQIISPLDSQGGGGGFDHFSQTSAIPSPRPQPESSDIPAIRRMHVTSGYRDGLSSSKNAHIQRGFDDGFPVGAALGLRVGVILGTLEGLVTAQCQKHSRGNNKMQARALRGDKAAPTETSVDAFFVEELKNARRDLGVEKVFEGVGEEATAVATGEGGAGQTWKGEEKVREWEGRVQAIMGTLA